ncbi:LysM peptidoglycan-binding domain-containing protein [Salinicoccus carnicancri]|uniref:LysM peptidoglycan-binding domain-containing protein n=1 Tax=Salinicoccus carnicancri TaxID=558170 RepID=UPI0002F0FA6F|nr:CHAP domain-containing protein [Salinicoccus carnicancri]
MKKVITALTATAAFAAYGMADDAEASSTYKVQGGDTLWKISQENGVSVSQLKSWNNLSSDLILVNQTLTVSKSGSADSSSSSSSSESSGSSSSDSSSSDSQTGGTYTVKAGDTLSSIARAHGMNYRTLMNSNNISSHLIYPGQKLTVNGSSSSSSSSSQSSSDSSSASEKKEEPKSPSVSAPSPSNVSYGKNYYYWGDCTWYVFERRQQLGKPVGNNWGNASNWDNAARSQGYSVSSRPSVGAILQANAWTNSAWGMGHVAIVERINSDGSILVSEMNFGSGQGVKTFRTISSSQVSGHNFIH